VHREDYARAGLAMLPVVDPSGQRTFRMALIWSLWLLPISLMPCWLGLAGRLHLLSAVVCGMVFLIFNLRLAAAPSISRARAMFFASLVYLPVVLGTMLVRR
jgi:protoheme IX farnesyltransferase